MIFSEKHCIPRTNTETQDGNQITEITTELYWPGQVGKLKFICKNPKCTKITLKLIIRSLYPIHQTK